MVKYGDKVTILKNKYYKGKKGICVGHSGYRNKDTSVTFRNGRLMHFKKSEIKRGW